MEKEQIEKLKKDLEERIANREAIIVAYGDRMPKEKFEELANWKKELAEVNEAKKLMDEAEKTEKEETTNNEEPKTEANDNNEENPEKDDDENNTQQEDKEKSEEKTLNITIHKKTGEVTINDGNINQTFMMSSNAYKKRNLTSFRENLADVIKIPKEDREYMKNVDPTLAKAYFYYDGLTGRKNEDSLLDEYIKTVIARTKAIKNKEKFENNPKLGNVKIDIGWHPTQKDKRETKKEKFGLSRIARSFRANSILKKHGMNSIFHGKKMELATVVDNRKRLTAVSAIFAALGTTTVLTLSSGKLQNKQQEETSTEQSKGNNGEKSNNKKTDNKQNEENKNQNTSSKNNTDAKTNSETKKESKYDNKDEKEQSIHFQFGDEVSIEKYSLLYSSSTSKDANGALNTNERLGVNKLACEINGEIYSTKDHSFDEIYKMAEKAGVNVRYHVDKMKTINGKNYVKVNDIYVCNENGTFKTEDGKEWKGDVEYSSVAGWVKQKDIEKGKPHKETKQIAIDDDYER